MYQSGSQPEHGISITRIEDYLLARMSTQGNCMGIKAKPFIYKQSHRKGFTLVEVAASLLAFSIVVVIFASSVIMSERTAHVNGQYAQAISLCQHKIDQLRAVGFGRLNYDELTDATEIVDSSPTTSPYSFVDVDDVAEYLPNPTATLIIETPYNGDENKAKVTATITWRSAAHESKTNTFTLVGIITNVE